MTAEDIRMLGMGPFHYAEEGGQRYIMSGTSPLAVCAKQEEAEMLVGALNCIYDDDPETELWALEDEYIELEDENKKLHKRIKELEKELLK